MGSAGTTVNVDVLVPLLPLPEHVTVTDTLSSLLGVTVRVPDTPDIDKAPVLEQLVAPVELQRNVED
ncbi:hypothetical protein NBRC116591_34550 [Sessilibacter corallicola]|uniref:Uncharacterized protein n=1 Tax=Sessilibacter corallicola TaxID=2904075 RepID=A0ABQ0ADC2_9GAMM